jgi:tRNA pseudouridine55 synthase
MTSLLGFVNIHKPSGITSHDVVNQIRHIVKIKQIGHAGTLDPMASGVLPIAIGKACRLIQYLANDKIYLAEILLGTTTDTDDIEGKIIRETNADINIKDENILSALNSFVGTIEQKPPMYSAIHVKGKRLYELARTGQIVDNIPTRQVEIKSIEVLQIKLPIISVRIACSSGTYIRSIARDLGEKLNCGACLNSLVREKSGSFKISESIFVEKLKEKAKDNTINNLLVIPQKVLPLPSIELDNKEAIAIQQGKFIVKTINNNFSLPDESDDCKVMTICQNNFVAICNLKREYNQDSSISMRLVPEVVINGQ